VILKFLINHLIPLTMTGCLLKHITLI